MTASVWLRLHFSVLTHVIRLITTVLETERLINCLLDGVIVEPVDTGFEINLIRSHTTHFFLRTLKNDTNWQPIQNGDCLQGGQLPW